MRSEGWWLACLWVACNNAGPEQFMKIDDRKINRSIDDNRLIIVDWHQLVLPNR